MKTKSAPTPAKRAPLATVIDEDWLKVSTEGFAEQNAARDPGHIVKELVQNSFDAIDGRKGDVWLSISGAAKQVVIICMDNGEGIKDLDNIRTVFWTSKQDSVLNRGRMGRGFKEALCLATNCMVESGKKGMHFVLDGGKRKAIEVTNAKPVKGTTVKMWLPWDPETVKYLETYFQTFLPPANIQFLVNKTMVEHRKPKHVIDTVLTTEKWEKGKWLKPATKTKIHLVPTKEDEEPLIFEMGIPVTSAEWDQPYHIDIQQRVPMNPNRDAVATGYAAKLHKACLPTIIKEMEPDDLRTEWVGEVADEVDEHVQREIIKRGFGSNVVTSVPTMGDRRDFDADAEDMGKQIVKTSHLSEGFRNIFRAHVQSSAVAVVNHEQQQIRLAAESAFDPVEAYKKSDEKAKQQRKLIEKVGGRARVEQVIGFALWFSNKLLEPDGDVCSGVNIGVLNVQPEPAHATWSNDNVLTLGLDCNHLWQAPLSEESLTLLGHECAHARAMHHGKSFHDEVERLSGRIGRVMFDNADHIRKTWKDLL
jgi:hypothetical protein